MRVACAFLGRPESLHGCFFKGIGLVLEFPALPGASVVWQRVAFCNGGWRRPNSGGGFLFVRYAFEPDADGG